jgi:dephospho-CoA kinase
MRELAFADPAARSRLEAILHPMIRAETVRGIAQAAAAPYAIVVVPLLVESGSWHQWLDRVLVVDCPVQTQIERVMRRSALARAQVEAIVAAQASRERRLAAADDVVDNDGDAAGLEPQVRELHARYLALAAAAARGPPRRSDPPPRPVGTRSRFVKRRCFLHNGPAPQTRPRDPGSTV